MEEFALADFQVTYEIAQELSSINLDKKKLFIYDEIQNVHGWERWVRKLSEEQNVKVVVTGSNSEMLSSELASSLTGRHIPKNLTPFLLSELLNHLVGLRTLTEFQRYSKETQIEINKVVHKVMSFGIFPRPFILEDASLLPIYLNDIITRDIIYHG